MGEEATGSSAPADKRSREGMLIEAGLALSSELSLDAVLQRIIELAAQITGARYGALGVLGADGRITEFVTTGISIEERRAIGDPPTGRGVLGVLINEAVPLRLTEISAHPRSVGFPDHHPPMKSFLGAPVVSRGRVFGNIYLTEKHGAPEFSVEDEEAIVVLAAQAGIAIENARLYEEAGTRERRLEAVREIATAILTGAGSDEALRLVAKRARELVGADLASILLPQSGNTLRVEVADGEHADEIAGMSVPIDRSISGDVVRTGRPVFLEDAETDDRAHQPLVQAGEVGPAILVPLSVRGEAFGTLGAARLRGRPAFLPDDLRLLEAFADQAAVALEYARAQREIHRLAVLEDRERIAKDLHDGVIQSLFAVGMGIEAAASLTAEEEMARRLDGAVSEIDRVIRDLRNYIFGLRPGILADRQLDQAMRDLVRDFEEKTDVVTTVDIDQDVAAEVGSRASELIQIVREALSNVGRHAEATTCRVTLRREDEAVLLEIDDDGKGFDETAVRGGDGLMNIRKRAEGLGGEVTIDSSTREGTTVRILVPG